MIPNEIIQVIIFDIFIIFMFILVFFFRYKIKEKLSDKWKTQFSLFISYFRCKFENRLQIIIPVLIVLILDLILVLLTKSPFRPDPYPLWFNFFIISILGPIAEEIYSRGLILGALMLGLIPLILEKLFKIKIEGRIYEPFIIMVIIVQALLFTLNHNNINIISYTLRFSSGILYGFLYLYYKRNLFPALVAHITHNILVNSGFFLLLF